MNQNEQKLMELVTQLEKTEGNWHEAIQKIVPLCCDNPIEIRFEQQVSCTDDEKWILWGEGDEFRKELLEKFGSPYGTVDNDMLSRDKARNKYMADQGIEATSIDELSHTRIVLRFKWVPGEWRREHFAHPSILFGAVGVFAGYCASSSTPAAEWTIDYQKAAGEIVYTARWYNHYGS